jgi:hypothetical protein
MITKTDALLSLRPGAEWTITEDDLIWNDQNQLRPTDAEVDAEVERLQVVYASKEYQRKRASEYPSIPDQLDTLYHGGYDAWKATIQAVKDKYPKE